MDNPTADCSAIFEATAFLSHFNDLPDPRQAVKVIYPLGEVLLLSLLAVLAGAEAFTYIARFGETSWRFCAGSAHSSMGPLRMIASAISSPPSTPNTFSGASPAGSPR
jgi:hypothetical protein